MIIFGFLESLWHKETECKSFENKILQIICIQSTCQKEICAFLVFLNYTSGYLKFCTFFANVKWHGQGLFKNVYIIIFRTFFLQKLIVFPILTLTPTPSAYTWCSSTPEGIGLRRKYTFCNWFWNLPSLNWFWNLLSERKVDSLQNNIRYYVCAGYP